MTYFIAYKNQGPGLVAPAVMAKTLSDDVQITTFSDWAQGAGCFNDRVQPGEDRSVFTHIANPVFRGRWGLFAPYSRDTSGMNIYVMYFARVTFNETKQVQAAIKRQLQPHSGLGFIETSVQAFDPPTTPPMGLELISFDEFRQVPAYL